MSNAKLTNLSNRIEAIFESDLRKDFNKLQGQLFVVDTRRLLKLLKFAFSKAGLPNTLAIEAYNYIIKELENLGASVPNAAKKRALQYSERIKLGKTGIPKTHSIYPVKSYREVQEKKNKIAKYIEKLTNGKISSAQVAGQVNKGNTLKDISGDQIGHGQHGSAIVGIKSQQIQKELIDFGDVDNLITKLVGLEEEYKISTALKHDMIFTAKGTFRKRFTAIISSQSARVNQLDAKREAAFINKVRQVIAEELPTLKASPSIEDALIATTLHNLATGKNVKSSSKGKQVVKSSGKGKSKGTTVKQKDKVNVISGSVLSKGKSKTIKKGVSSGPLQLISILNSQLPKVVMENMQSPALVNRTGRFANSVKVTNITSTTKGYPSIAYTYDLFPYQTFEPGFKQGSIQRDPRRLIDSSIREIASRLAIGRFYTRRI